VLTGDVVLRGHRDQQRNLVFLGQLGQRGGALRAVRPDDSGDLVARGQLLERGHRRLRFPGVVFFQELDVDALLLQVLDRQGDAVAEILADRRFRPGDRVHETDLHLRRAVREGGNEQRNCDEQDDEAFHRVCLLQDGAKDYHQVWGWDVGGGSREWGLCTFTPHLPLFYVQVEEFRCRSRHGSTLGNSMTVVAAPTLGTFSLFFLAASAIAVTSAKDMLFLYPISNIA